MKYNEYLDQRNALMAEVEALIGEGKIEESNAKMEEVKALDNKWESIKLANANLNALKDNNKVIDLENKNIEPKGGIKVVDNIIENKRDLHAMRAAEHAIQDWRFPGKEVHIDRSPALCCL